MRVNISVDLDVDDFEEAVTIAENIVKEAPDVAGFTIRIERFENEDDE
jgi:hypothetical protein